MVDARRLTNGVMDLLFESDAGWQVVDYKTDSPIEEGRYAAQLEAYKAALRKVGCVVAGASVVNVRTEKPSELHGARLCINDCCGPSVWQTMDATLPDQGVRKRQAWSPCSCAQRSSELTPLGAQRTE